MKTFLFFLVLLSSFSVWAQEQQCASALSRNFSQDMAVFYLRGNEVEEYDLLTPQKAIHVVDVLLKRESPCTIESLGPSLKAECKSFGANVVCEVRTTIGYFLVHRGSFGHFEHSVVWARWD